MSDGKTVIDLIGGSELDAALLELDQKLARKIGNKALRAGAKIIQAEAKAEAPKLSGATERSIKVRTGKNKKYYRSIKVGLGDKWFTGQTFYASFLEFGHHVGSRKLGSARTWVEPEHFMEHSANEKAEAALTEVMDTLAELLNDL